MAENHGGEYHGPPVVLYLLVFLGLCVFTAVSFLVNWHYGIGSMTGLLIILGVAICKAGLVGAFFMHLKFDSPMLRRLFITGIILASIVYTIALFTLRVLV